MQQYEVSLTMLGSVSVKANTEEEAISIVKKMSQQDLRMCMDEFVSVDDFAVAIGENE